VVRALSAGYQLSSAQRSLTHSARKQPYTHTHGQGRGLRETLRRSKYKVSQPTYLPTYLSTYYLLPTFTYALIQIPP
jgi:hypothetical protein